MLISLSHRFLFVANVKTASSSIEAALRPFAEIAICETRFGKHMGLSEIEERFDFIFQEEPLANFFKFAVVRDPLDMLISLYASHQKPDFIGQPHYTGGVSFEEFLNCFRANHAWQLAPQVSRLTDRQGQIRMDYLINFDHLEQQFADVLRIIGLPNIELPWYNESPSVMTRADISAALRRQIAQEYRQDRLIKRTLTGRPVEQGSWQGFRRLLQGLRCTLAGRSPRSAAQPSTPGASEAPLAASGKAAPPTTGEVPT